LSFMRKANVDDRDHARTRSPSILPRPQRSRLAPQPARLTIRSPTMHSGNDTPNWTICLSVESLTLASQIVREAAASPEASANLFTSAQASVRPGSC
jgi:hypothetical protein